MDEIIKSPSQAAQASGPNKRKLLIGLTAAVSLFVLAAAGYVIYKNTAQHTVAAAFLYTKYNTYKVEGSLPGNGMSFDKPAELVEMAKSNSQVELVHQWRFRGAPGETYIAVLSQNNPGLSDTTIANTAKILAAPKNSVYKAYTTPVNKFISDRAAPKGWTLNMEAAKPFTNIDIKNNAWSFNYTISSGQSKLRGEAIYALKGNNYYYFMILSNAHNWESSFATWQHIFDSIKIDQ